MSALVPQSSQGAAGGLATALARAVSGTVSRFGACVAARRTLIELSRLDDRTLKDIGYCRIDLAALGWAAGSRGPMRPASPESF